MSEAPGLLFVRLPDFVRTTIFRWTSAAFAVCILLFSAFVYWEAAAYLLARMDTAIAEQSRVIAAEPPDRQLNAIEDRLSEDPRRIKIAGMFDADGHRIAGNLESVPRELVVDATVQTAQAVRIDQRGRENMTVRAVARRLQNGNVLVIAGHNGQGKELAEVVARALLVALPFAIALSLAIGAMLSVRVQRRITDLNALVRRIIAGNLHERIPVSGLDHPFDKLAVIANGMLDEIAVLVTEMAGIGNGIAHDLRTPLTRVRIGLERGRANATTLEELQSVADRAVGALDQSLTIITALLRITEIENSRGRAGFSEVALADLVREVGDFYSPMAEDQRLTLRVTSACNATAYCDRDLLFEAVANLVDNATKFTPAGGRVDLCLVCGENENIIRVSDTGPGIGKDEREAVMRRFYRSDKSRNTPGVGLGLSLVSAILKLHGFRLTLNTGPGCVAEIVCPTASD
ncbi:MAG: two-component sensor histidine kinase [Ramlibacter sp.]|jgi:signal transduction histidine kinase|nr:two-component sensor histidine kinase [Ramlibacter sp.]